ncbi:hypothetical protein ASPBRDRAFT_44873 [Aspergillus brasiliensis CBS 101740]|uniref:Secreted protein n=1 Tax=Aspergillus brasiliensis (strain CBS 101740 / IMI 381727 / IBT 21946) TaxID=767769 RepID=A0A1L9UGD1_ASPBC|nr:hypothetical protein ASPBRDRAFT_44873 [Aspergillus brasiliensis CBS 101740]
MQIAANLNSGNLIPQTPQRPGVLLLLRLLLLVSEATSWRVNVEDQYVRKTDYCFPPAPRFCTRWVTALVDLLREGASIIFAPGPRLRSGVGGVFDPLDHHPFSVEDILLSRLLRAF